MNFLWPAMLWSLLAVPVLVMLYMLVLQRQRRGALRYANLNLVKQSMGTGQRLRRHVPPLLFLLGLILMMIATARPTAVVTLPAQDQSVVLAIDVSGSMRATDVEPNRLAAAQAAATAFVADQPQATHIGVVAFAASAALVQAPTRNRDDVVNAIERLQLQYGTAIGSGILVSLATIFPDAGVELGAWIDGHVEPHPHGLEHHRAVPVPPGSYAEAAIILLTDGQSTTGPDALEAASIAADRGVRVFTVGIGTPEGDVISVGGWSARVRLDEEPLKRIAEMTGAEYFYAGTASDLRKVYQTLNTRLVLKTEETEISALFAAAGALIALLSALLSLWWFNRIV
jgi:Ca-activated chloride channel homolog